MRTLISCMVGLLWLGVGTAQAQGAKGEKAPAGAVRAIMNINVAGEKGVVELELDKAKAPISVDNFVKYAKAGFYSKTIFHRVIPNFMAQGGGFEDGMKQKSPGAPIKNESDNGLKNDRGTIAMARTSDPDSATAQFYINLKNNDFLNGGTGKPGYAVFGKVVKGMEVVDKIAAVPTTTSGMFSDVPQKLVIIESVTIK